MTATPYTTQPYDTWERVATLAYGDPSMWPQIAAANPQLPLSASPPIGVKLWVPVISAPAAASVSVIGLPPWKRT